METQHGAVETKFAKMGIADELANNRAFALSVSGLGLNREDPVAEPMHKQLPTDTKQVEESEHALKGQENMSTSYICAGTEDHEENGRFQGIQSQQAGEGENLLKTTSRPIFPVA